MIAKTNVLCPVCASGHASVLYQPWITFSGDPIKLYGSASGIRGTQLIVACRDCGMIYENPRYPDQLILQAYIDDGKTEHDSQYPVRVRSFLRALRTLRRHIPPPGAKILDIGTAGGAFLEAAQKFGYHPMGLEPAAVLVDRARKRGLPIEQGSIAAHPFEPASFDMICLWDVLEHLPDPLVALKTIRTLLRPGGLLLINYPDIGTWMARFAGRRFWWLLSVHLHYFSRRTLTLLAEHAGFEMQHAQRYWQTLEFGYLEDMAVQLNVPLSGIFKRCTPQCVQRIPIPYYASQTTAILRVTL